jgi:predicted nucleic acid-binding protein
LRRSDQNFKIDLNRKGNEGVKSWDLDYTGTVMVLYEAFVRSIISYDELVDDLAKLTKVMWISTDVITEVIKRLRR